MNIRGLVPFTLVDYPEHLACVVFTGHCNFRCPFCHNPCLIFDPESQPEISRAAFADFLKKRNGKLDGVVISGGEATLQSDLADFCREIHEYGYSVKLDTNGSRPDIVEALLKQKLVDALGIDFKAPAAKYQELTGSADAGIAGKVVHAIQAALNAGVDLDVRTTVHRRLLEEEDLRTMRKELDVIAPLNWVLQQFNPVEVIDDSLQSLPTFSDGELVAIAKSMPRTRVRGLTGLYLF